MNEGKKIGLIAGRGDLPLAVLKTIKEQGTAAVVIGLKGEASNQLADCAQPYYEYGVGQLVEVLMALKLNQVQEIVFAGKIGKEAIFAGGYDQALVNILSNLPEKNDDAISLAIISQFEKQGFAVAKQTDYLRDLLIPAGSFWGELTKTEEVDVQLGFKMAKAIGELDLGQSVVVKQGVILAVEAIEGTDQAILRGGSLGGPGAVVVKTSKPNQDLRFDVPTVGRETITNMIKVGATVLAVEAEKTFVVDKEESLALAQANNIKVVAL